MTAICLPSGDMRAVRQTYPVARPRSSPYRPVRTTSSGLSSPPPSHREGPSVDVEKNSRPFARQTVRWRSERIADQLCACSVKRLRDEFVAHPEKIPGPCVLFRGIPGRGGSEQSSLSVGRSRALT